MQQPMHVAAGNDAAPGFVGADGVVGAMPTFGGFDGIGEDIHMVGTCVPHVLQAPTALIDPFLSYD